MTVPQSLLDYLKNLTSDITIVQGDFDDFSSPEHSVMRERGEDSVRSTWEGGGIPLC